MSNFFAWLMARLGEASTYNGLATLATSVGVLGKVHEMTPIADTLGQIAGAVVTGVNPIAALAVGAASAIAAIVTKDKGSGT